MKHLKRYSIFESGDSAIRAYANDIDLYESVKEYLKDIFQELEDDNFLIDIEGTWMRTQEFEQLTGYEVKIKKAFNGFPIKTFLLEDIYDYILTCKSYLKDMGFFISEFDGNIGLDREKYANYYIRPSIGLPSDQEELKLFNKPLISLTFKIRKSK